MRSCRFLVSHTSFQFVVDGIVEHAECREHHLLLMLLAHIVSPLSC
jgi:hypothetical protein